MICEKTKHHSKKAAKKAQHVVNDDKLSVYFCKFCMAWHLGHSTMKKVRHKVEDPNGDWREEIYG